MIGMRAARAMFFRRRQAWLSDCPLVFRRWICATHMVLIAGLSLVPAWLFPPSLAEVPGLDKWVHVAMYGLLGALLRWAAGNRPGAGAWRWPVAGAGYGLLLEWLQLAMCGGTRAFSWGDVGANLAGVVVFWLLTDRALARTG